MPKRARWRRRLTRRPARRPRRRRRRAPPPPPPLTTTTTTSTRSRRSWCVGCQGFSDGPTRSLPAAPSARAMPPLRVAPSRRAAAAATRARARAKSPLAARFLSYGWGIAPPPVRPERLSRRPRLSEDCSAHSSAWRLGCRRFERMSWRPTRARPPLAAAAAAAAAAARAAVRGAGGRLPYHRPRPPVGWLRKWSRMMMRRRAETSARFAWPTLVPCACGRVGTRPRASSALSD